MNRCSFGHNFHEWSGFVAKRQSLCVTLCEVFSTLCEAYASHSDVLPELPRIHFPFAAITAGLTMNIGAYYFLLFKQFVSE